MSAACPVVHLLVRRRPQTPPGRGRDLDPSGVSVLTVLIWLNGPHGVGKTQVAFELHRRLPGSVVRDPEHLVTGLHRMLPEKKLRTDPRGVPLWRYGVRDALGAALPAAAGPVITPMTVCLPGHRHLLVHHRRPRPRRRPKPPRPEPPGTRRKPGRRPPTWPPSSAASSSPPDLRHLALTSQHPKKSTSSDWPEKTLPHNRESRVKTA